MGPAAGAQQAAGSDGEAEAVRLLENATAEAVRIRRDAEEIAREIMQDARVQADRILEAARTRTEATVLSHSPQNDSRDILELLEDLIF